MEARWFIIPVNPEPWAVGSLGIGKRGGKFVPTMSPNPQLVSFKEAVKEHLTDADVLPSGEYALEFYFWRRLDQYKSASGRKNQRHQADTTNMQKATEDALQGVLFDNDRNVRSVYSDVIEQGTDVTTPGIIIGAGLYPRTPLGVPTAIMEEFLHDTHAPEVFDNSWPPREFG